MPIVFLKNCLYNLIKVNTLKQKKLVKKIFFNENLKTKYKIVVYKSKKDIRNNTFLIINKKKFKNLTFIFFYSILKKITFNKNIFLVFSFKHILIGQNIIPDWPGKYLSQSFEKNLFLWIRYFCKLFFFKKKIDFVVIKIK